MAAPFFGCNIPFTQLEKVMVIEKEIGEADALNA
jgi:hypothetical protein